MSKELAKLKKKGKMAAAEGIKAELERMESQDVVGIPNLHAPTSSCYGYLVLGTSTLVFKT